MARCARWPPPGATLQPVAASCTQPMPGCRPAFSPTQPRQLSPTAPPAGPPVAQVMMAGVMAGFGLWGSMFPIDTIKSKMQVGGGAGRRIAGRAGSSAGAVAPSMRAMSCLCCSHDARWPPHEPAGCAVFPRCPLPPRLASAGRLAEQPAVPEHPGLPAAVGGGGGLPRPHAWLWRCHVPSGARERRHLPGGGGHPHTHRQGEHSPPEARRGGISLPHRHASTPPSAPPRRRLA